jgi:hypothetical protein
MNTRLISDATPRVWREGLRVGLYDPKWTHRIDQHANVELGNKQRHRDIQKKETTVGLYSR